MLVANGTLYSDGEGLIGFWVTRRTASGGLFTTRNFPDHLEDPLQTLTVDWSSYINFLMRFFAYRILPRRQSRICKCNRNQGYTRSVTRARFWDGFSDKGREFLKDSTNKSE